MSSVMADKVFFQVSGSAAPDPAKPYLRNEVTSSSFDIEPTIDIGFRATAFMMRGDDGIIEYSFNGRDVHGILNSDRDFYLAQDDIDVEKIWLRVPAGGEAARVRVWAWIKQR